MRDKSGREKSREEEYPRKRDFLSLFFRVT